MIKFRQPIQTAVTHRIGGLEMSLFDIHILSFRYTPHRWLRKTCISMNEHGHRYTPHRWLRNQHFLSNFFKISYTPHRWLRNNIR